MTTNTAYGWLTRHRAHVMAKRRAWNDRQFEIATQYERVVEHLTPSLADTYVAMCACIVNPKMGYIPRNRELAAHLGITLAACNSRVSDLQNAGVVRRGEDGLLYLTGGDE